MIRRLLITLFCLGLIAWAGLRVRDRVIPQFYPGNETLVRGVFHVHSEASHDCEQTLDEVALAAQTRGLDFVVVTDHNAQLAGPVTRHGITLLSSAELSTPFGHVVQMGAGYLLPKEDRARLNLHSEIKRLGGFSVLAHPGDPKRPWNGPMAGVGGIEIANISSSARRQAGPLFGGLIPALLAWRLRPTLAFAQLYDRDTLALKRWDGEREPRVAGYCGNDAHGRIDLVRNLAGWEMTLLGPLPKDEKQRPAAIMDALSQAKFQCTAGIFGRPRFHFYGRTIGDERMDVGDTAPANAISELVVFGPEVRDGLPPTLVLLRNGHEVMRTQGDRLRYLHPKPGSYRVEVRIDIPHVLTGATHTPVAYSNRIRVADAPVTGGVPQPAK